MNSFHETLRFTAHALISPVHAVVDFFAPWEKDHKAQSAGIQTGESLAPPSMAMGSSRQLHKAANQAQFALDRAVLPTHHARRKVRVLRVIDAAIPSSSAGRMVISGRLSEVCAELERMSYQSSLPGHKSEVA